MEEEKEKEKEKKTLVDGAGAMASESGAREDVVQRCIEALANAGATPEFCLFYADIISCEYDLMHTTYRMQKQLKEIIAEDPLNCDFLFVSIQAMTKRFYGWKGCVDDLARRGSTIPPLTLNPDKLSPTQTTVKALCSLETTEMNLRAGEDLTITDATRPDRLRVRNSRGEEGYVPALCCLLPSPDDNATNAVERLQVHLLTSWTDCVKNVKRLLFDNLSGLCKLLAANWRKTTCCLEADGRDRERVNRRLRRLQDAATLQDNIIDLGKLHKALIGLEKELHSVNSSIELSGMIGTVSNLDKAVLCYHSMYKQWRGFRDSLKEAPRPIRLVLHFDQMLELTTGSNFKYYEIKMTLDEIEILEEITYISSQTTNDRFRVVLPGGTSAKHEALSAEELTSSVQEEKKHFVIRSVVDLRDDTEVSLQAAIADGIIDAKRGVFVDLATGKAVAIPLAMSEGFIRVEYVSTRRSAERKEAVGLITIRTQIDRRGGYVVTGAVDSTTAEKIDADEARRRGIIVSEGDEDWFVVEGATGEDQRIPLVQAIDQGWVTATYEDRPISGEDRPICGGDRPISGEDRPIYGEDRPIYGEDRPIGDGDRPIYGEDRPISDGNRPIDDGNRPIDDEEPQVEVHAYAVSAVRDPAGAAGATVSFAEAVRRGLIDRETGDYVNAVTGERVAVVEAIQSGLLKATLVEDVAGLNVSPTHSVVVDRVQRVNQRRVFRASQKKGPKKKKTETD